MSFDFKSLTLFKIIALVLIVLCFVMMFLPWINMFTTWGYSETGDLFYISGSGCFWTVLLKIFEIFFFAAIVLAVFGILTDRSLFVLPVAVLALLMFLSNVGAVSWVRGQFESNYGSFAPSAHAGIGAWLFLFFGLGAFGLLFYEDRTQGRNTFDAAGIDLSGVSMPKVNLPSVGGWNCPTCGAKNGASQNFCTSCGTKKPEPPRCPNCGKLLKTGEAFCSNCGTRV